jgi:hypothetical protein
MAWRTRSTTLSSVGTSTPIILDPTAKTTVLQLSLNQNSSLDVTIQVTLDDPAATPAPTVTWTGLSTTHYSSTTLTAADGIFLTVLSPIGGLRISSSTIVAATTITLKSLQAVSA